VKDLGDLEGAKSVEGVLVIICFLLFPDYQCGKVVCLAMFSGNRWVFEEEGEGFSETDLQEEKP